MSYYTCECAHIYTVRICNISQALLIAVFVLLCSDQFNVAVKGKDKKPRAYKKHEKIKT